MIFTLTIFQNNLLEQYDKTDASIEIMIMLFVSSLLGFLLGYFMSHRTKKEFVYNDVKHETSNKSTIEEKFNQAEKEATLSSNDTNISRTETAIKTTISKAKAPRVETQKTTTKKTNAKLESVKTAKKTVAKAPVSNSKSDLKVIEGIGPGIEKLLNANNINTYQELSNSKIEVIQQILNDGGPRFAMHSPETWPMQAQLLFDNRMEDFKKLTEELKGGKIVK